LDPGAAREVESLIGQIRAGGTKIVMTTHNLGQAKRLGDEILFMSQGRLVERTPVDQFFAKPHQLLPIAVWRKIDLRACAQFFAKPQSAEADAFIRGELPWS